MSDDQRKKAEGPEADDQAKAIEDDIEAIRAKVGGLVSELDHRRHDFFDLKKQLTLHAIPLALAGLTLVGLAIGGTALVAYRRRQRQAFGARLVRLRRALARMIDKPEQVASAPRPERKIATAGATAVVSAVAKRLAERAMTQT